MTDRCKGILFSFTKSFTFVSISQPAGKIKRQFTLDIQVLQAKYVDLFLLSSNEHTGTSSACLPVLCRKKGRVDSSVISWMTKVQKSPK